MKILHINSYYSASRFYKNLYDKQIANGLDIAVYVPVPRGINIPLKQLGEYTTVSSNHNKYDRIFFHLKHKKIYADVVKKYEIKAFDIVHAHSLFSNGYIALKLKRAYGSPYIVAVRNTDVNTFFKYMIHLRKLGIEIMKEAEKVIFLSSPYRDLVIEKYVPDNLKDAILAKTEIIPNGIDDFWIKNKCCLGHHPKQDNLKLLYVGVIDKNKNLLATIKAIRLLQQKGYDVQFTVVGKIVEKSIYQQITALSFVKYIKPKPKEELIEIYRACNIFVMPSITETFGLVYAEAMSQGLPVVYTKGQGFDGQFEEGVVGYHVECFNAEEIASRIVDIEENHENLSANCVELYDKFNWSGISSQYEKIYRD